MLDRIGWIDAVIARETPDGLELIDGHLRAELDPDQEIPVLITDLNDEEAAEALATFDPLTMLAKTGRDKLAGLVGKLPDAGDAKSILAAAGFQVGSDVSDVDPVERPDESITQPGDLWLLGRHRLICGDATDPETVARVLDGNVPTLMITDPPYGVEYDPAWRSKAAAEGKIRYAPTRVEEIEGDDRSNWAEAWKLFPGDVVYAWHPPGAMQVAHFNALAEAGFVVRTTIIWRKQHFAIGRGHYHVQHEPCFYAVRRGRTAGWIGDRRQSTIWEISTPNGAVTSERLKEDVSSHSTQKPLECMERPISNHWGSVYDPFVGSGTTIIGAERQGRRCFAVEIDPGVCDVAVKRWEGVTGETAERVSSTASSSS